MLLVSGAVNNNPVSTLDDFQPVIVDESELNPSLREERTPEETVAYYFQCWQAKDMDGMDSVYNRWKGYTEEDVEIFKGYRKEELEELNSVTLFTCEDITREDGWYENWYPNAYDTACVKIRFAVNYKEGSYGNFVNDKSVGWFVFLTKETEDSDWMIETMGAG